MAENPITSSSPKPDRIHETLSRRSFVRILLPGILIAVGVVGVAGYALVSRFRPDSAAQSSGLAPTFHRPAEDLVTSEHVLLKIGSAPAETPSIGALPLPEVDRKPLLCPPEGLPPHLFGQEAAAGGAPAEGDPAAAPDAGPPLFAVKAPIPGVDTRAPQGPPVLRDSPEDFEPEASTVPSQSSPPKIAKQAPQTARPQADEKSGKRTDEALGKSDEFKLPGSLTVKIRGYEGSVMKWMLLVIYDDSAFMGRKVKSWGSDRGTMIRQFIEKLPTALTPGSKLAVKDFHCKAGAQDKDTADACGPRLVYGWSESPFGQLTEKLAQIQPGGKHNPCAAVAQALRKDFSALGDHSARILIVTDGSGKCATAEIMKAVEQLKNHSGVAVDVLSFAPLKKKHDGYGALIKRTSGVALKIDRPAEVDATVSKYAKTLQARTMEKVEIRGEKTKITIPLDEEATVAPGTYDITLPPVAGIVTGARLLTGVKIGSGEAKILDVKVKKGRPTLKADKK